MFFTVKQCYQIGQFLINQKTIVKAIIFSFTWMFRMLWITLGTQDSIQVPHWSFRTVTDQLFGCQFNGGCPTNPIFRHFFIFGQMDFWKHWMPIIRSFGICHWYFIHFFPLFTGPGILFVHGKNPIVIHLLPKKRQRSRIFTPKMDFWPMDPGFAPDRSSINGNFRHGVWKSQKKSHSTLWAQRTTFKYILSGQKFIKNAKNGLIWRVFET